MTDYEGKARALQTQRGWAHVMSLNTLVESWVDLVEQCEDGYEFGYDEWSNDAAARLILEQLEKVPGFSQTEFWRLVADADDRIRALFIPGVQIRGATDPWWMRGVLRNASSEYTSDVRGRFGVPP